MNVGRLSPANRDLLIGALLAGELVNVLYRGGQRMECGFSRERRCFALGERGWLSFLGWDGAPGSGDRHARWTLTAAAQAALQLQPEGGLKG